MAPSYRSFPVLPFSQFQLFCHDRSEMASFNTIPIYWSAVAASTTGTSRTTSSICRSQLVIHAIITASTGAVTLPRLGVVLQRAGGGPSQLPRVLKNCEKMYVTTRLVDRQQAHCLELVCWACSVCLLLLSLLRKCHRIHQSFSSCKSWRKRKITSMYYYSIRVYGSIGGSVGRLSTRIHRQQRQEQV